MALPQPRADWNPLVSAPQPRAFDPQAAIAGASPARALQQLLDQRTQAEPQVDQWSRRRQVAFIVASCCAMWMALLAGAAQVVRAIA